MRRSHERIRDGAPLGFEFVQGEGAIDQLVDGGAADHFDLLDQLHASESFRGFLFLRAGELAHLGEGDHVLLIAGFDFGRDSLERKLRVHGPATQGEDGSRQQGGVEALDMQANDTRKLGLLNPHWTRPVHARIVGAA